MNSVVVLLIVVVLLLTQVRRSFFCDRFAPPAAEGGQTGSCSSGSVCCSNKPLQTVSTTSLAMATALLFFVMGYSYLAATSGSGSSGTPQRSWVGLASGDSRGLAAASVPKREPVRAGLTSLWSRQSPGEAKLTASCYLRRDFE